MLCPTRKFLNLFTYLSRILLAMFLVVLWKYRLQHFFWAIQPFPFQRLLPWHNPHVQFLYVSPKIDLGI